MYVACECSATGGCTPAHPWEKPYCYSLITLASKDQGLNWAFRSVIEWDGAVAKMPAQVPTPTHNYVENEEIHYVLY